MNWLAHLLLSPPEVEYQLGNLLADPLRGRAWHGASEAFLAGLSLHREIDRYTDQHELVQISKYRLGTRGRLRGVIVDVVYDHFLSRHWPRFCAESLPDFVSRFYVAAEPVIQHFPPEAKTFVRQLIDSRQLESYGSRAGLDETLARINQRLSKRLRAKETTDDYTARLDRALPLIERDFLEFFPELQQHIGHTGTFP